MQPASSIQVDRELTCVSMVLSLAFNFSFSSWRWATVWGNKQAKSLNTLVLLSVSKTFQVRKYTSQLRKANKLLRVYKEQEISRHFICFLPQQEILQPCCNTEDWWLKSGTCFTELGLVSSAFGCYQEWWQNCRPLVFSINSQVRTYL